MSYGIWYQPRAPKPGLWTRGWGWLKFQLWGRWHARLHIRIYEAMARERHKRR